MRKGNPVQVEFLSPAKKGLWEITIKKSRFIGRAAPASSQEEAEAFVAEVRAEHPDATHNVYAYSVGEGTPLDRLSDDGEPRGTAGYPILDVIHKRKLRNVVCVVTRYYGGTPLGAGGLLRAYGRTARGALDNSKISNYTYHDLLKISLGYDQYDRVQRQLVALKSVVDKVDFTSEVTLWVYVNHEKVEALRQAVTNITAGKAIIHAENGRYIPR